VIGDWYATVWIRHLACSSVTCGSLPHQHLHFTTSKIHTSAYLHVRILPMAPSLPIRVHSFSPPFPFLLSPSVLFVLFEVSPLNPARWLGSTVSWPAGSGDLGQSPSQNQIWYILDLKFDFWWPKFSRFSWQTTCESLQNVLHFHFVLISNSYY